MEIKNREFEKSGRGFISTALEFVGILTVIALVASALFVWITWNGTERSIKEATPREAPPAPVYRPPTTFTKTLSILPGEAENIKNRRFRKIEIRSDFPLRILSGNCHSDYTVQFFCQGDPSDIFITDTRPRPIFRTPRANAVTITVTEF